MALNKQLPTCVHPSEGTRIGSGQNDNCRVKKRKNALVAWHFSFDIIQYNNIPIKHHILGLKLLISTFSILAESRHCETELVRQFCSFTFKFGGTFSVANVEVIMIIVTFIN